MTTDWPSVKIYTEDRHKPPVNRSERYKLTHRLSARALSALSSPSESRHLNQCNFPPFFGSSTLAEDHPILDSADPLNLDFYRVSVFEPSRRTHKCRDSAVKNIFPSSQPPFAQAKPKTQKTSGREATNRKKERKKEKKKLTWEFRS